MNDDLTLIARIADGDAAALSALYDRHAPVVFGLAQRIARNPVAAEEVVMETFLQVWQQAAHFDQTRPTVVGWVVMIARGRALDRARQARGSAGEAPLHAGSNRVRQQAPVDQPAGAAQGGREVAALPAFQRIALELAFFEGLTHSEIADVLCQPISTVRERIRDGLHTLKDGLAKGPSQAPVRGPSPFTVALMEHLVQHPRLVNAPRDLAGLRVLVVDDDAETLELVSTVLESAGATVVAALSTVKGLAQLDVAWPDVILADITMPRDDGYSLLAQARALADRSGRSLTAAAFTALGAGEQEKAVRAGFAELVSKPVRPNVLVELVARLASRAA